MEYLEYMNGFIDGQRPLRPIININASREKINAEKVNAREQGWASRTINPINPIVDCYWFNGLLMVANRPFLVNHVIIVR